MTTTTIIIPIITIITIAILTINSGVRSSVDGFMAPKQWVWVFDVSFQAILATANGNHEEIYKYWSAGTKRSVIARAGYWYLMMFYIK